MKKTDMKRTIRQILSTSVFAVMLILAAGTALAFAAGARSDSSYVLTIIKELPAGSPAGAYNQEYTFLVQAGEQEPQIVTITGAGSEKIEFGDDVEVTVVEVTDHIQGVEDRDGNIWYMTTPQVESSTTVLGRKTTVNNGSDGGRITIKRPDDPDAPTSTWFKVTGTPFGEEEKTAGHTPNAVEIKRGGEYSFTNLPRGVYEVEELKAPEGFSVTANDHIEVAAGAIQTVVIHGSGARMTIHAPGKEGDGHIHYFVINGPGYRNETVSVESEETYVLEHLSAGTYTISEWEHPGKEEFSVTTPVVEKGNEKIYYYSNFGNYVTNSDYPANEYAYLGLRIGAAVGLPVGTKYKTQIVGTWRDTGT